MDPPLPDRDSSPVGRPDVAATFPTSIATAWRLLDEDPQLSLLITVFESFVHFLAVMGMSAYVRQGAGDPRLNRRFIEWLYRRFIEVALSPGLVGLSIGRDHVLEGARCSRSCARRRCASSRTEAYQSARQLRDFMRRENGGYTAVYDLLGRDAREAL